MIDIVLESFRALVILSLLAFLWRRQLPEMARKGWKFVLAGFVLLAFGSVIDITDNFEELNSFVVIGDTDTQSFLEKVVGYLGGFCLLAFGLVLWIPYIERLPVEIEKRKTAEDALIIEEATRYSERRFRDVSEVTSDWIWETDADMRFSFVSQQIRDISGLTPEDAIGQKYSDFIVKRLADGSQELMDEHFRDLENKKVFQDFVICLRDSENTKVWVESAGKPYFDKAGAFLGYRGSSSNITERTHAQQLSLQTEKMEALGNLAGGVAHDINNMLLPIIALSEMTKKAVNEQPKLRERLDRIVIAANRASELVAQILAFSRQKEPKREDVDIRQVVQEALKLLGSTLPSTIRIISHFGDEPILVNADSTQVSMAIVNLGTNAAHAIDRNQGELEVGVSLETIESENVGKVPGLECGDFAHIQVRDTGCGMDEETKNKIFNPFFTTKDVGEGTGLGLSVIHGIVTQHEGVICVDSQLGIGTTFDLYFPTASETASG